MKIETYRNSKKRWPALAAGFLFVGFSSFAVAPTNDVFASARVVSGNNVVATGSILEATRSGDDPQFIEDRTGSVPTGSKTLWFKWVAPYSGQAVFSTGVPSGTVEQQSTFDAQLGIYAKNDIGGGDSPWNLRAVGGSEDGLPFAGQGGAAQSWAVVTNIVAGTTYWIMLAEVAPPGDGIENYILYINPPGALPTGPVFANNGTKASVLGFDVDSDNKTDLTVFDPSSGNWYYNRSAGGSASTRYGWSGLQPLRGDFDGDGKSDPTVYDPKTGIWYIKYSTGGEAGVRWGWAGTIPVPGDYNGDRRTDVAIFDPVSGYWYIRHSGATPTQAALRWGWNGVTPVPGDYDGDGKTDIAVFYPADGYWYITFSGGGSTRYRWGWASVTPLSGDFNGDGMSDLAVFDGPSGTWYVKESGSRTNFAAGRTYGFRWGWNGVKPVPGDYDGDNKTDFTIYDPNTGDWYIRYANQTQRRIRWGWPGAIVP